MKKTIKEIYDQYPDATLEEIGHLVAMQDNNPESDLPEEAPAPVAPVPSPPVAPAKPVLNEAQQYAEDSKQAQSRVKSLFDKRDADAKTIGGQIEGEEDSIRATRQDSRLESGLAAGGKVLAGTLGGILKYDAKPQIAGFESAEKSIAARPDETKQRREFLKERLYRTDDATKSARERLTMQGVVRNEVGDASAEADEFNQRVTSARNKTARNEIDANKLTLEKDKYDAGGQLTENDKARYKLRLQMLAKKPGPNQEVAQAELDNWGQISDDGIPLGTDLLPPEQMRERFDAILKADKAGQKWRYEKTEKGDLTGGMLLEETTGEMKDLGSGLKTRTSGSGSNKEEDMTLKLSDRVAKANLPALKDSLDRINETIRKNGGKVKNIDGTDTVSRMTPTSLRTFLASKEGREFQQNLANMSNQVLKAAAGSAVTVSESERVMIEELGQGRITDPDQIQTGVNMVNSLYDQINTNIKGGFTDKTKQNYKSQGGLDLDAKASDTNTTPAKSWRDLVGGK